MVQQSYLGNIRKGGAGIELQRACRSLWNERRIRGRVQVRSIELVQCHFACIEPSRRTLSRLRQSHRSQRGCMVLRRRRRRVQECSSGVPGSRSMIQQERGSEKVLCPIRVASQDIRKRC